MFLTSKKPSIKNSPYPELFYCKFDNLHAAESGRPLYKKEGEIFRRMNTVMFLEHSGIFGQMSARLYSNFFPNEENL
jgi:hypothetical protein